MKITPINYNILPSFGAKKKEVRKADDIQRRTRQVFPVISNSYIRTFYNCSKNECEKSYSVHEVANLMFDTIFLYRREIARYAEKNRLSDAQECLATLEKLQEYKKGNCHEMAQAAKAALCANGFYNTDVANLEYQIDLVDKESGRRENSYIRQIDHCLAVTDMNKGGEKDIIVDQWLGFAGSKSDANARYKSVFEDDCIKIKKEAKKIFGDYDKSKYMETAHFNYREISYDEILERQELGEKAKEVYGRLVI